MATATGTHYTNPAAGSDIMTNDTIIYPPPIGETVDSHLRAIDEERAQAEALGFHMDYSYDRGAHLWMFSDPAIAEVVGRYYDRWQARAFLDGAKAAREAQGVTA